MEENEAQLLERCRQGDSQAWDKLFDLHYGAASRFVFQLGHDLTLEDVEEICQEAFLSVIKNIFSFHGKCRFQTWLFQIAANKARDYRQHKNAAKRGGGQVILSLQAETNEESGLTLDPPSSDPSPDVVFLKSEQSALLSESLDQLDTPCREVIELRYFGDLSYEEIAQSLKLNSKTVSSRLSKCLDKLESIARAVFSQGKQPFPSSN